LIWDTRVGSSGLDVLGPPMKVWPNEDSPSLHMGDQSGLAILAETGSGLDPCA